MSRRNAGEGSIRQRSSGTWEARYRAADGRRRSVYGKTKREVTDRLRAAQRDTDSGLKPLDQRLSVEMYLRDWLEADVRPNSKPATHRTYERIVTTPV